MRNLKNDRITSTSTSENESLDKAYVIQLHDNHKLTGEILSKDTVSKTDEQKLQTTLSAIQTKLVASSLNLSEDELKQLQSQSKVSSQVLSDSANGTHLSESQKHLIRLSYMQVLCSCFHYHKLCQSSSDGNCN